MDTEHIVTKPMRGCWVDEDELERVGMLTATEIRKTREECIRRAMMKVAFGGFADPTLTAVNPWINEHMRRALAVKAKQDVEEKADRPMKEVTYVRCNKCNACREYSSFLFHGARLSGCTCKMGEEEWVKVKIEVPAAELSVKAP